MQVFQCDLCKGILDDGEDLWLSTTTLESGKAIYRLDFQADKTPDDYNLCNVCFFKELIESLDKLLAVFQNPAEKPRHEE